MLTPKKFKLIKQSKKFKLKSHCLSSAMYEDGTSKLVEDHLLIRKLHADFTVQILESLVAKGLSGQQLVEKFKEASYSTGWTIFRAADEKQ